MARIYCSNCGKLTGNEANFCPFCGAAVRGKDAAAYTRTQDHTQALAAVATPPPTRTAPEPPEEGTTSKTVERENPSPIAQVLFGLHYLKTTGVVLLMAVVVAIIDPIVGIGIAAGYLVILFVATHLIWSNYFFSIDSTHFHKQHGILHKKSVTIPFEQIQNVNITRSLVDQIFGLAAIDIETAGNSMSDKRAVVGGRMSRAEGHLSGIDFARAKEIHDILLQKVTANQRR